MALEKWLGLASLALFAMFSGLMVSVYGFLTDVPDDFDYALSFEADPKILQFISISAAPAGVMGAIAFIMSKYYGSRPVGLLLIGGGGVMLAGMYACHVMLERIDEAYVTDAVALAPYVFMGMSAPVVAFGARLFKRRKRRPKKEYF
ncbi:MAG: hypothetical protein J4F28_04705 [Nitrosopumilaceae archaeon]|nr:hypothetical protein [Nitrosopumilaceae archaeon]